MLRKDIEKYINENYNCIQEHPWDDDPDSTTFKHCGNKKWFALIMKISYRKLDGKKDEMVDVMNLKNMPEIIGGLRKTKGIFPAYHMNKEHWISIVLDGTIEKDKIYELIDMSYILTKNKRKKMGGKDERKE